MTGDKIRAVRLDPARCLSGRLACMKFSREHMERIISQSLDSIPRFFRKKMENIEIVLEPRPSTVTRQELKLSAADTLYGLYQGIPQTRRGAYYGNVLPDKITLYQEPLESASADEDSLAQNVRAVLIHEIGHYFGLSEKQLRSLEKKRTKRKSSDEEPAGL